MKFSAPSGGGILIGLFFYVSQVAGDKTQKFLRQAQDLHLQHACGRSSTK